MTFFELEKMLKHLNEEEKQHMEELRLIKQILEKKYISVDMGDNSQLEQLHDLQSMLKNKLNEYRDDTTNNVSIPICYPENNIIRRSPFEKVIV
jgi:hypothetical protein